MNNEKMRLFLTDRKVYDLADDSAGKQDKNFL